MKTFLIPILAASTLTAAAGFATTASAQAWININQRQAQLDHRIDVGVRNGQLTRREAYALRMEFQQIARLEAQYRRTGGLQRWEMRDLDRRFDILSAKIRYERRDRERYGRGGYGYGYGYDHDGDGRPDRSDRYPYDPRRW
ncbi:MAG: hypothetical protein ACOY4K_05130 [Pseudomonadota bacterium]